MPSFEQGHLTVAPDELDIDWMNIIPRGSSLPALVDPTALRAIERDCGEHLVDVSSSFGCIEAYRQAGWKHSHQGTFVRYGVAQRLLNVSASLPAPFGIVIFDGWRSLEFQSELYNAAYSDSGLPEGFLAPPSQDECLPPPHVSGGTVDLTLSFDGVALALGTSFDCFNDLAQAAAFELNDSPVRRLRRMLFNAMWAEDFIVYSGEWWHFEFGTPRWSAIRNEPGCYQRIDDSNPDDLRAQKFTL